MKYATAMDVFIVLCFFSVFMALVEFALINFIDTLIKNRKKKEAEKEERAKQRVEKAKVLWEKTVVVGVVAAAAAAAAAAAEFLCFSFLGSLEHKTEAPEYLSKLKMKPGFILLSSLTFPSPP